MDYSDESYVRLYTRKTLTWKLLGWEGRTVRNAMLDGEFDAAGIFQIRGDAATCISAVTDLPIDIVRIGLQRLIETDTWVVTEHVITWPTYEEAQNCKRSDRVRQRESRRVRSAQSVTDVTGGHRRSQASGSSGGVCHSLSPSLPPSLPPFAPDPPVGPPSGDKPKRVTRKKPATARPDPFVPLDSPGNREAEKTGGLQRGTSAYSLQLQQFSDHHDKHGTLFSDWQAAWRTWCRNTRRFAPNGAAPKPVLRTLEEAMASVSGSHQ